MGLNTLSGLVPALIIGAACIAGICRGEDVFSALTAGAAKGLRIMRDIFPALVVLFPAIYLLRASGLPEHIGACDTLLLSMRGVPSVDVSAAQTLLPMLRELKERGIDVVVCGVPTATMTMLRRAGIVELLGEQSFYWSVERALLDHRPRPLASFDRE